MMNRLGLLVLMLLVWGDLRVEAEAQTEWKLPEQAAAAPSWPPASIPFDLQQALALDRANGRVESAYLEALAEFSPEVWRCRPGQPAAREVARVQKRIKQFEQLVARLADPDVRVSNREVERLVEQFADGYEKLQRAQRASSVVFRSGLRFSAALPHLDAARYVARISILRVQGFCRAGEIEKAVNEVALLLRLARDLRTRGFVVSQAVSMAIDRLVLGQIVTEITSCSQVRPADCKRLLKLIQSHQQVSVDPFQEAVRMDYVMVRTLLEDIQYGAGDFAPAGLRRMGFTETESTAVVLAHMQGRYEELGRVKELEQLLNDMDASAYASELTLLSGATRRLLQLEQIPFRSFVDAVIEIEFDLVKDAKLLADLDADLLALVHTVTRWRTHLAGTQCSLAVRMYELAHGGNSPENLLVAVNEAGLSSVPADPYTGGPFKLNMVDGVPVVYSLGMDLVDQRGEADSRAGRQPGDVLFPARLANTPDRSQRQ